MPVHLTGRVCDMSAVIKIARKYKLKVIEMQTIFGSKFNGKMAGTFGDIGCISLHPLKNFNGLGDGGFVLTNSLSYYKRICGLRNHGIKDRNF